jgi:hypothetical protein
VHLKEGILFEMRPVHTTAFVAATAAVFLLTSAGPALAAAPVNDTYAGRTVIGTVPFTTTVDTSQATTDADDAELNATCGAPATDASVWFEYTAAADSGLIIDVSASSYTAGVLVGTGGPGHWTIAVCGPDAVFLPAVAGQTYAILAIDDQGDGGGNGGTLQMSITEAPPQPVIDVTVNPTGTYDNRTGSATIGGTVTCTGGPSEFSFVQVELREKRGRFTVVAIGNVDVTCDATTRPWSIELVSENGPFGHGDAASVTFAVACGQIACSTDFEERQVLLRNK